MKIKGNSKTPLEALIIDVDGVILFGDKIISPKITSLLEEILRHTDIALITAASVERLDQFVLSSFSDSGKNNSLKNLQVFAEIGLIELSPDLRKNMEERIVFRHINRNTILSLPFRDRVRNMTVVSPWLYNPFYYGKDGEAGRDHRGKKCFFYLDGKTLTQFIMSSDKRVLITLEKRRNNKGEIDPRIKNAAKEIEDLKRFLEDQKIEDVGIMETPTSVEIKPKGWDKSIPAATALERIAKKRGKSVEEIAKNALVLGDSDTDRVMGTPMGLKVNIPFIKIRGESHTCKILQDICKIL